MCSVLRQRAVPSLNPYLFIFNARPVHSAAEITLLGMFHERQVHLSSPMESDVKKLHKRTQEAPQIKTLEVKTVKRCSVVQIEPSTAKARCPPEVTRNISAPDRRARFAPQTDQVSRFATTNTGE